MVLSVVRADGEAREIAPERLTANRLRHPAVYAARIVVVSGVSAGASLSVELHVKHQLGQRGWLVEQYFSGHNLPLSKHRLF